MQMLSKNKLITGEGPPSRPVSVVIRAVLCATRIWGREALQKIQLVTAMIASKSGSAACRCTREIATEDESRNRCNFR